MNASGNAEPSPAIRTSGLVKRYVDGAHDALAALDLVVPDGQRVALIGHNGSGKSTLIGLLAGMLEPTAGTVEIVGHPAGSMPARAAVSYLADQPAFYDDLSVWEHLEYVARLHDTPGWEQQAADLLEMVGLTARADDLPATFSRGLRQKAAICVAFVRPFDLLVVDEPFVGLDLAGRDALLELLRRAHAGGASLVVATHELATLADSERLLALRDGEVVHDGPVDGADAAALVAGQQ